MTTATPTTPTPTASLTDVVLAVGPGLSVAAGVAWGERAFPGHTPALLVAAIVFMWLPHGLSVPALLTQDRRDRLRRGHRGLHRVLSALAMPVLCATAADPVLRRATRWSYAGVLAGIAAAAIHFGVPA